MTSSSITTAFWGDNDTITSVDNIIRIVNYGGYLLETHLMEINCAIESWREYYEMTSEQVDLLKSIYDRKVNNPHDDIILSKSEVGIIETENQEGLYESMTSFEEIDVFWEE